MRYIKNYEEKINEEFKIPQFIRNYKETGDLIKDKVYENLQIAKDKINDPENIRKLNDFLDNVEETTTKISNTMKNNRNLKIIENMLTGSKWIAIVTSVYQLIFNTTISLTSFSLGGIGAIKIALFLYILKLIVNIFRNYNNFISLTKAAKDFVINITKIFKTTNNSNNPVINNNSSDNISESYILYLTEKGII